LPLFFPWRGTYKGGMRAIFGWGRRSAAVLNEDKGGPWGPSGGGGDGDGKGPRSPWGQPPRRRRGGPGTPSNISSLEDFLKKSRDRFGGRLPQPSDGRPYWLYGLGVFLLLWVLFTSFHQVGPQEKGVVTLFGAYSRTVGPGINLTLPAPIEQIQKVDVYQIRKTDIGSTGAHDDNLVLTGDQNLLDVAYSVRWQVRDPQLYLFALEDPDDTVKEVAKSAMRAVIATVRLDDAMGAGRGEVASRVALGMQQILDRYGAGIHIDSIIINQTDPPAAVNEAFKKVTAAQQYAQSDVNNARAYAQQTIARAQGDAAAFDQIYAQYKLAPDVTRRRLYYETMERVLSKVDKTVVEAPGVTPYLPLPEVQKRVQQGAAQEGAPR
jgi:membrane protease subunit HflK